MAPFVGAIYRRCSYSRMLIVAGAILFAMGVVCSSLVESNAQLSLAFAVAGFGNCVVAIASTVALDEHVSERFKLFYSIGMSGFAFGMTLVPLVSEILMDIYNWRGSMMILGGLIGNMIPCALAIDVSPHQHVNDEEIEAAKQDDTLSPRKRFSTSQATWSDQPRPDKHESDWCSVNDLGESEIQSSPNEIGDTDCKHECQSLLSSTQQTNINETAKDGSLGKNSCMSSKTSISKRQNTYHQTCQCIAKSLQLFKESDFYANPCLNVVIVAHFLFGIVYSGWHAFLIPHAVQRGISPLDAVGLTFSAAVANFTGRIAVGFDFQKIVSPLQLYLPLSLLNMTSLLVDTFIGNFVTMVVCSFMCALAIGGRSVLIIIIIREFVSKSAFYTVLGAVELSFGTGAFVGGYLSGLIADKVGSYSATFRFLAGVEAVVFCLMLLPRCVGRKND